jgi:transglutaminase-like putative cysteine protease
MSNKDLSVYLQPCDYIDFNHASILEKAKQLSQNANDEIEIAKACFEFVRDDIKHSWDYQLNPITCKASDVLKHGTGYCYAKSHLLAALLRANGIATGLCYQRLTITDEPPFCLHGLNAVYLSNEAEMKAGWYRIDARGNKEGIDAQFTPPIEKLAFPIVTKGELDLPEVWHEPLPEVIKALQKGKDYLDVAENLPDIQLF